MRYFLYFQNLLVIKWYMQTGGNEVLSTQCVQFSVIWLLAQNHLFLAYMGGILSLN